MKGRPDSQLSQNVTRAEAFQKALRAEPEFVDPAHDEDTPVEGWPL